MMRVDRLLVERGLVASRAKGQRAIRSGSVAVEGVPVSRVSTMVSVTADLSVAPDVDRFVSRGGEKLRAALDAFDVEIAGRQCVDLGASTGGFTHCLLEAGALSVVTVDVGTAQLHRLIAEDERVTMFERLHIADADVASLGGPFDVVVADLSFISMRQAATHIARFASDHGSVIVLVKPQFEVGRGGLTKRGVVRDENRRVAAIGEARRHLENAGLCHKGEIPSPLQGTSGNEEVLFWMSKDMANV
jgi:23S rRNA (cytidine1920-2'-O)/16S rRNA (cytidine1409-2'-O)-methyltransferase